MTLPLFEHALQRDLAAIPRLQLLAGAGRSGVAKRSQEAVRRIRLEQLRSEVTKK